MLLASIEPRIVNALAPKEQPTPALPRTHLLWFLDGLLLFFAVPWVCTTILHLDNDLYYAIFVWITLTFFYYYVITTRSEVLQWVRTRWRSSLFFGLLASIYVVVNVSRVPATARPSGLELAFEVVWRGVIYGATTSVALVAFPFAVALGLVRAATVTHLRRRLLLGAVTFGLVWVMSATYHLGFEQFDRTDLVTPQLKTTAVSLPTVITANPIGSVMAEMSFHIVVTIHAFESDVLVPPSVEYVPDYAPPGIFGPR